ncbi:MAG: integrase [Micavibrio aeruginosavorus]|uniref:Integrase n=1 Tax=Micavibrio aeruginosavorus TaxID=349221 RepID=A0A2W5FLR1_9BACT|nr:MAG: integrase [Micavibrio aeruginosavorus]
MVGLVINPNLTAQAEKVREYFEQSLSENSRRAYRKDFEHFVSWGGYLPSSPDMVAAYLSSHAGILSIATLQRRLVSIGKANVLAGFPNPGQSSLVKMTFKGVRRVHNKPQRQVQPILKEDVIMIVPSLPQTNQGKRNAALIMLAFCGAFRRSELISLKCENLKFTPEGMVIRLNKSKTDQLGEGREVAIPLGNRRVCPVHAIKLWLEVIGSEGPLFRQVGKGGAVSEDGLSSHAVAQIIKRLIKAIGYDPSEYSGHSTRAGFATSAAQAGKSSWTIRRQTGHKSDQMLNRYIRQGNLFKDNAAALF